MSAALRESGLLGVEHRYMKRLTREWAVGGLSQQKNCA
jgi:hypothetical protein